MIQAHDEHTAPRASPSPRDAESFGGLVGRSKHLRLDTFHEGDTSMRRHDRTTGQRRESAVASRTKGLTYDPHGRPRPEWMNNPQALPKAPPAGRRLVP